MILQSLTSEAATSLVHAFISCCFDYCNALLYGIAVSQLQRLQSVQNAAARLVTGLRRTEHIGDITPILKSLHWLPIRQLTSWQLWCINGRAPEYLAEFRHPSVDRRPGMRSADSVKLHVTRRPTYRLHLVTGRLPSLVHAPGTTYPRPLDRLVSVILNIRKTVEIYFACLTTAVTVIFNWRSITNATTT